MATITPDVLTSDKPIQTVQPVDTTNYQSVLNDAMGSLPQLNQQVTDAQTQQDSAFKQLQDTLLNQQSASDITGQVEATNNVDSLKTASDASQAKLRDIAAQSDILTRQAQIIPLQVEQNAVGQMVTKGGNASTSNEQLRVNAIKALTLGQQADIQKAVATNDYTAYQSALDKSNKLIDLKLKDQQLQYDARAKNLDLITSYKLAPAQAKQAEAQKVYLGLAQEQLKSQAEEQKGINDMVIQASIQGADPASIEKAKNAKSRVEAAQILGEYAGDFYKTQQLRAELAKTRAEGQKITAESNKILADAGLLPQSPATLKSVLDAIALGESAGSGDYKAVGPLVTKGMYKGQQALGRYQVMPGNLAQWSQEALGRKVTQQEFLNSPELQDTIAGYQFTKNYEKYGNWEDAASIWFTGSPAIKGATASDDLGTTGAGYVQKFRNNLASVVGYTGNSGADIQNQKIQANIASGKIAEGQIVSKATGDSPKSSQVSAGNIDGLLALRDLTNKVNEYESLYNAFESESLLGGAGLLSGARNTIKPTANVVAMRALRSEITDLLARARSGAALTAYETAAYEKKLPGTFNSISGLGTQGTDKIKSLKSSLLGTLNSKMEGYGVTFAGQGVGNQSVDSYLDNVGNTINKTSGSTVSSYANQF